MFDASTAYLWALAEDSKGVLYTGGGNPGASTAKLFALDASRKSRVVAELPGLEIHAIAIDRQDRIYVATAPDGKVSSHSRTESTRSSTTRKQSTSGPWHSPAKGIYLLRPATMGRFIGSNRTVRIGFFEQKRHMHDPW
ncbi:MAG: hypothetical protein WKF37_11705 [Bryobacteraceae bacterium]